VIRARPDTSFRATDRHLRWLRRRPCNAHDPLSDEARPRGFEPLTFGSVDRGDSARFGSSKPFRSLRCARKAPENQNRRPARPPPPALEVGTLAPGGGRAEGPRQVRRLPLVRCGRLFLGPRRARSQRESSSPSLPAPRNPQCPVAWEAGLAACMARGCCPANAMAAHGARYADGVALVTPACEC
jgi:hypothetical protein